MLASHLAATAAVSADTKDKIFKRHFIKSISASDVCDVEPLILIELQGSLNLTSTASKGDGSRIRIGEIDLENKSKV